MEDQSRTPADERVTDAAPADPVVWDPEADEIAADTRTPSGGRRSRRRWWVVGTALVLLATAVLSWMAIRLTTERATARTLRYDTVSDTEVLLEFDVTRPPDRQAVCLLRAEDNDHATLGVREIIVPASKARTTVVRAPIRTTYQATNAVVDSCRLLA